MASEDYIDLSSADLPNSVDLEGLQDGIALGTWSTASTVGTASCPISSAGCAMTANCAG